MIEEREPLGARVREALRWYLSTWKGPGWRRVLDGLLRAAVVGAASVVAVLARNRVRAGEPLRTVALEMALLVTLPILLLMVQVDRELTARALPFSGGRRIVAALGMPLAFGALLASVILEVRDPALARQLFAGGFLGIGVVHGAMSRGRSALLALVWVALAAWLVL